MSFSGWDNLFNELVKPGDHHVPGSPAYIQLKQEIRREVEKSFSTGEPRAVKFGPFGELLFPYFKMGNIDSLNLFDLDEIIIFSFYHANRRRYQRVVDIGANIGLHSVILGKCGFDVRSYEPDPRHFEILRRNLKINQCSKIKPFNKAVSSRAGEMEFIRVLGNTTASHLAGSKTNPYGELERFPVKVAAFGPLIAWADLIKLDVEGHEKVIILATNRVQWQKTDVLVEIENQNNAAAVYEHLTSLGVNLFTQKTGWQKATRLEDVPNSYREGMAFITCNSNMSWSS